jgi:hypothetical protein
MKKLWRENNIQKGNEEKSEGLRLMKVYSQ